MGFAIVNMMNVKRSGYILMSTAILTGKVISFSNLMSKRGTKLFRVADIKPVPAFAGKRYAIRAIYSIVSTLYKADGFRDRTAAAVTRDGDCIVMPVIAPAPFSGFCSKFAFAFMRTKIELNSLESTFSAFNILATVCTLYRDLKRFRPMAWQKLSWPTPIIERG